MRVLVLNPGSSTLKAVVLEPPARDPLAAIEVGRGDDASRATDRGVVVVMDPRLVTKSYGRTLLEGLPPARRLAAPWEKIHAALVSFYAQFPQR